MTIPLWMLLGFAMWNRVRAGLRDRHLSLQHIFTGRAGMASFPADGREGRGLVPARHARARQLHREPAAVHRGGVRAAVGGISSGAADAMATVALAARVCQSLVHISCVQTDRVVTVRFSFFFAQLLCFIGIAGIVVARVG
jgi:hypothetical protein